MTAKAKTLTQWIAAIPLVFVLGFVYAGTSWKASVDNTNCTQSDSIYVNAVKYGALQEYCVQLQAVNRAQTERIESLEISRGASENILRELYRHQVGREWEE